MGASGALVMGFFGAGFAALALLDLGGTGPAVLLPFLVFAAIAAAAIAALRRPGPGFRRPARAGPVMAWSSAGEGLAIFAAVQGLQAFGRPDLIVPATAVIVGLHFVPIARWAPFPPLYPLAAAVLLAGIAGLAAGGPAGTALSGFPAAAALWVASLAAVRREWLARG